MDNTDEVTLRFLAAPTHRGYSGNVDAGRVLEWIDKSSYALATMWTGGRTVTAYVGNVRFRHPVHIGDLVEVMSKLIHTGRSSLHILVTVDAIDPRTGDATRTTSCLVVFVAIDNNGRSKEIRKWEPRSLEDARAQQSAIQRIELRAAIEKSMAEQQYTDAGSAPRILLRFLAAPMDVNWGGNVHGGFVMRWIDEAAHVLVTSYTHTTRNVAVYTGGIRFYQPMHVGDLVEVEARLLHTGRTSMHVSVHVRSGDPRTMDLRLTTHCLVLFVSLDDDGNALEAPVWVPVTAEDLALDRHAVELAALRDTMTQAPIGDSQAQ